jgi:hypothetical protein
MEYIASKLLAFGVYAIPITTLLPVMALIESFFVYSKYQTASDEKRRSFSYFFIGLLSASIIASLLGIAIGGEFFCDYATGNLCGLGGFFFVGRSPLSLQWLHI